eukprot:scaffold82727_cov14-Tisochrysis_lutea.AAC.1
MPSPPSHSSACTANFHASIPPCTRNGVPASWRSAHRAFAHRGARGGYGSPAPWRAGARA